MEFDKLEFVWLVCTAPKPPLCKGRWAKSMILLGGVVIACARQSLSQKSEDFCQLPLHKGALGAPAPVRKLEFDDLLCYPTL